MLIEIHILQNHSPSNLNRDDTGSPKDAMFGGVRRARISSQCLKRTIRRSEIFRSAVPAALATRTRRLPELVRARLVGMGVAPEMADVAARKATGFGNKDGKERDTLDTAQTMFLTDADIDAIAAALKDEAAKAGTVAKFEKLSAGDLQKAAVLKGYRPITADVALFARMTTSEALRDVEAACQVAHAISTHKVDQEFDYFTAVDDLQGSTEDDDAGADMIGDVEFNSACYYKYFSIDASALVANLCGPHADSAEKAEAAKVAAGAVAGLLRAAVLVSPSGKQNSFAANQLPAAVLVEIRPVNVPVSYANAFVAPSRQSAQADLVTDSFNKLRSHVEAMTECFSLASEGRYMLALDPGAQIGGVTRVANLDALVDEVCRTGVDG